MTSFQDRVEEKTGSEGKISDYFSFATAHSKFHLFCQTMGKRESVELDQVTVGVAFMGDEGCDDNCSLWDGSSCKKKAIGLLLFVS